MSKYVLYNKKRCKSTGCLGYKAQPENPHLVPIRQPERKLHRLRLLCFASTELFLLPRTGPDSESLR
jgi:hypothetical protein